MVRLLFIFVSVDQSLIPSLGSGPTTIDDFAKGTTTTH